MSLYVHKLHQVNIYVYTYTHLDQQPENRVHHPNTEVRAEGSLQGVAHTLHACICVCVCTCVSMSMHVCVRVIQFSTVSFD